MRYGAGIHLRSRLGPGLVLFFLLAWICRCQAHQCPDGANGDQGCYPFSRRSSDTGQSAERLAPRCQSLTLSDSPSKCRKPCTDRPFSRSCQQVFADHRRMPGVGINAHVRDEEKGELLQLIAESVPITETPRLEAREFSDAVPAFSRWAQNRLPILNRWRGTWMNMTTPNGRPRSLHSPESSSKTLRY